MAVHKDTKCIHVHFVIEPTSLTTGKQILINFRQERKRLMKVSDEICLKHGKSIIEKQNNNGVSYYEWLKRKQGDRGKVKLYKIIDDLIGRVNNYGDFKKYLSKLNYVVEDGLDKKTTEVKTHYDFSISDKMFLPHLETNNNYLVKLPQSKGQYHIKLSKENGKWTTNNKTFFTSIDKVKNKEVEIFDKDGNFIKIMDYDEIISHWENKQSEKKRSGLRIKLPNGSKFIRCGRAITSGDNEGYSLEEVIERIENNGKFKTDQDILNFINKYIKAKDMKTENKNANNRAKVIEPHNPDFKTKKQIYFEYKTKELQQSINEIGLHKAIAIDISKLPKLKTLKSEYDSLLKDINMQIAENEKTFKEAYENMLEGNITTSEKVLENMRMQTINPLKTQKNIIKEKQETLKKRILFAESKIKKEKER